MKKYLVTYFGPFGGESINPSQLAVAQLPDEIAGAKIIKKEMPVVFGKSKDLLWKEISDIIPHAIICIWQAGGRPNITVERVAINMDDARIPDNENNQPIDEPIFKEGSDAHFTNFPIKMMVKNCNDAKIPAAVSNSAGTYVCNHLMYTACHWAAEKQPDTKAGFIHIPFVPEQTVDKPTMPSMALADIVKGLEIMIKTIIQVEEDIKITGGAEH